MAGKLGYKPIILGTVGDSGAGKSTLADGVVRIIGEERVARLSIDDYHCYSRAQRQAEGLVVSDPENNYLDIAEQHLGLLRRGYPILKPVYDHRKGELGPPQYLEPKPYIIVDGILAFSTRKLRENYDLKIYMDTGDDLRTKWKVQRDTERRGYSPEQVHDILHKTSIAAARYIQPQRAFADIVIDFYPADDEEASDDNNVSVRHMLRPTINHPRMDVIIEEGIERGISLELSRDENGKPVDILQISGNISDEVAEKCEEFLWSQIPETSHIHSGIGKVRGKDNAELTSHTLAISQLLVACYLERAVFENITT